MPHSLPSVGPAQPRGNDAPRRPSLTVMGGSVRPERLTFDRVRGKVGHHFKADSYAYPAYYTFWRLLYFLEAPLLIIVPMTKLFGEAIDKESHQQGEWTRPCPTGPHPSQRPRPPESVDESYALRRSGARPRCFAPYEPRLTALLELPPLAARVVVRAPEIHLRAIVRAAQEDTVAGDTGAAAADSADNLDVIVVTDFGAANRHELPPLPTGAVVLAIQIDLGTVRRAAQEDTVAGDAPAGPLDSPLYLDVVDIVESGYQTPTPAGRSRRRCSRDRLWYRPKCNFNNDLFADSPRRTWTFRLFPTKGSNT
jgi:hypothetical protein